MFPGKEGHSCQADVWGGEEPRTIPSRFEGACPSVIVWRRHNAESPGPFDPPPHRGPQITMRLGKRRGEADHGL